MGWAMGAVWADREWSGEVSSGPTRQGRGDSELCVCHTHLVPAAVFRGPLLYAMQLPELETATHAPWACFETGCSRDLEVRSNRSDWAHALVLPPGPDGAPSTAAMRFERHGSPAAVPFAGGTAPPVRVIATARRALNWTMDSLFPNSAAHPPRSPVPATDLGAELTTITLVPFGATRLRVGVMPWTQA